MSAQLILAGSWSRYEEYKRCKGLNPAIFLPENRYEIDFLVNRIGLHYPQYTALAVELSINYVKRTLYGGCKRSLFVELVMNHLLLRQPLIVY